MTIEFGTRQVAEFRPTGLRGVSGIGFSRLQFSVEINLAGVPESPVTLGHLVADVAAGVPGGGQRMLGKATPQSSWFVVTLKDPRRVPLWLELDLAGEQIEALERLRGGGPLVFQFQLSLQVRQADQVAPGFEVLRLEVDVSQWTAVLKELGYIDLLVFALELPIDAPEELRNAITLLRMAYQDLLAGRYDATVGLCRKVMDSVGVLAPDKAAQGRIWGVIGQGKERRDAMTKSERAEFVRMAVRHFTHLDHHVGENGALEVFSRHDALFVLTASGGIIWEALARVRAGPRDDPPPQ